MAGRLPRTLHPGATIGIIAPASPVKPEILEKGKALLEARGYRVEVGAHVLEENPNNSFLAGTDAGRLEDLHAMFSRKEIDGILCAGGGYGSMRLLPQINWEIIAHNPKALIGFSDITSLHLAIARKAGFVTFHGAMLYTLLRSNADSQALFWRLLEDPNPFGVLPAPTDTLQTLVSGVAEGRLAGGCLTLLATACGSPFAPDFRGKIVLIEDVGEAIYRVDRYLIQLRNAGLLDRAAGFVIGDITGWRKHEENPERNTPESVWRDILAPLGKPILTGMPFGHVSSPLLLPLGVRARLDADAKTLTLLEPATRPA